MNANTAGVFIQLLRTVNEKGGATINFPFQTHVIRYPVHEGWIVSTVVGDGSAPAISQSFVPDPDHDWSPNLATDDQQEQGAASAASINPADDKTQQTSQT